MKQFIIKLLLILILRLLIKILIFIINETDSDQTQYLDPEADTEVGLGSSFLKSPNFTFIVSKLKILFPLKNTYSIASHFND